VKVAAIQGLLDGLEMYQLSPLVLASFPLSQVLGGIEITTAFELYEMHCVDPLSEGAIQEFSDKLGLAEAAMIAGDEKFSLKIQTLLSDAECFFVKFRFAQMNNDFDNAQNYLKDCVEASRSSTERNHTLEARARMEWGLLRFTAGEEEQAGIDLRWAMERLKALEEGSIAHGIATLNLAEWHTSRNEGIMALAILSDINREGPHKEPIIATSRLQISCILFELGDFVSSQRHAWVAFKSCSKNEMLDSAHQSALIWMDLSLTNIDDSAPRMSEVVSNATPRELGENPPCRAHPGDLKEVVEWCSDNWDLGFEGESRPDIAVLLEAERAIGLVNFSDKILESGEVTDATVLSMLNQ
jgi:hypothetical protein